MRKWIVLGMMLCATLVFAEKIAPDKLNGRWQVFSGGDNFILNFLPDGVLNLETGANDTPMNGTWNLMYMNRQNYLVMKANNYLEFSQIQWGPRVIVLTNLMSVNLEDDDYTLHEHSMVIFLSNLGQGQ